MTTDITINSAQHEQIENLYTLIDMAAAYLSVLMAAGQEGRFLVKNETVINSPWHPETPLSQIKVVVRNIQLEYYEKPI